MDNSELHDTSVKWDSYLRYMSDPNTTLEMLDEDLSKPAGSYETDQIFSYLTYCFRYSYKMKNYKSFYRRSWWIVLFRGEWERGLFNGLEPQKGLPKNYFPQFNYIFKTIFNKDERFGK